MPACSLSVRNMPMASSDCAAALTVPMLVTNPWGIPIHTSSLGIDTGGHGTLDISSRVIKQDFVVADVNADRRQP